MSLPNWVQGAQHPSLALTWYYEGTETPMPLSGATLSGLMQPLSGGDAAAITGDLVVTDAAGGVFRWDLSETDVANDGQYVVQFTATFASGQTPARTFKTTWDIAEALA